MTVPPIDLDLSTLALAKVIEDLKEIIELVEKEEGIEK